MIEPVKVVSFKDKTFVNDMPIYIKSDTIKWVVFLFLILIIFAVIDFGFTSVNNDFIKKSMLNIACISLILFLIFVYVVKQGNFVMAADEKGIYYRIYGKKDIFIFIEWRFIVEVTENYEDTALSIQVSY